MKLDVLIIGGGLAGVFCAVSLRWLAPDVRFMVVEQGEQFGGHHRWSFFDSDIDGEGHALLEGLNRTKWPRHEVRFPAFTRVIETGYASFTSYDLDRWARTTLRGDHYRLGVTVIELGAHHAVLSTGERIDADIVIDARGPRFLPEWDAGWQSFLGQEIDVPGHGLSHPIIMDTLVDQSDGYRFVYVLPLDGNRLFVEDTYYRRKAELNADAIREELAKYASQYGTVGKARYEEMAALPIPCAGQAMAEGKGEAPVAVAGMAAGFFHNTTGYSLPFAVENGLAFAREIAAGQKPGPEWWSRRAKALWRWQLYFRWLNRMLFDAAAPADRYKIFQHFYRLPDAVIRRFYRGAPTMFDKLRIVIGKPPVPIFRALSALLQRKDAA